MRRAALIRNALTLLSMAALTAGTMTGTSATFTAISPASQGFSTKADWVAPAVSIASPEDGSLTASQNPSVAGVAGTAPGDQATVLVGVWAGAGTSGAPQHTMTAVVGADGAWALTLETLADGAYAVRAEQSDAHANTGRSQAVTFTVDAAAPTPVIIAPTELGTVGPTPDMNGTAGDAEGDSPSIKVELWNSAAGDGDPQRTLSVDRDGTNWSVTAVPALTAGTWSARATQADAAGNVGASSLRVFIVRSAVPEELEIRRPAAGAWVASATPGISGRAGDSPGDSRTVTVKLYEGDVVAGDPVRTRTTLRKGQRWSTVVSPALVDGSYTAVAEQLDAAGNVAQSSPRTFHVEAISPGPRILTPVEGAAVGVTPEISGTGGTATLDHASVTVTIHSGSQAAGLPVQSHSVRLDRRTGAWGLTARPLAAGTYTIRAAQRGRRGDIRLSPTVTVKVDPVAPPGEWDISAVDGGGHPGRLDSGDSIAFRYPTAMSPRSMFDGWDGAPVAVRVRFRESGHRDTFRLFQSATDKKKSVRIAALSKSKRGVNTNGNYVSGKVTFAATMSLSADARTVVVTLGAPDRPGRIRRHTVRPRDMDWAVDPAARDAMGAAVVARTVSETDDDRDF